MTDCQHFQDLLPQYVADGCPIAPGYAALRAHLAACGDCRARAERLEQVEWGLGRWPAQVAPYDMANRIMAAIERETPLEPWSLLPWNIWVPALTVLVALALAKLLAPSLQGALPAVPWGNAVNGASLPAHLSSDPALLLALWIGVSMAVAGIGLTLALVHGRLPDEGEIDQVRHRLTDTAHRLLRMTGQ